MSAGHAPPVAPGTFPRLVQLLEAALLPSTLSEDAFAPSLWLGLSCFSLLEALPGQSRMATCLKVPLPLGTLRQRCSSQVVGLRMQVSLEAFFLSVPQRLL